MNAKGVRNMYSIPVVVNKHNTARVASSWFIIYYINGMFSIEITTPQINIITNSIVPAKSYAQDGSL